MPIAQEPQYEVTLPDDWRPTAWEPPTAALLDILRHIADADMQETLRDYLTKHPESSDAYNALGIAHALQQQWQEALTAFDAAVMLSNQYHHFVHYICSAIHTARAEWTEGPAREEAIRAALFQDHTNPRTLALQKGASLPRYDRPMWEDAEWPGRIRALKGTIAATTWNSAVWLCRDGFPVRNAAQIAFALHENGKAEEARAAMENAASLAHRWHRHYHRQASLHRLQRGRVWDALNEPLLALDEFRHAHDIDPGYAMPLQYRAALQQRLGNIRAAAEDTVKAAKLS